MREENGTYAGRAIADDEVRVAESILVLGDEVPTRMDLYDKRSEGFVALPERLEEVPPSLGCTA